MATYACSDLHGCFHLYKQIKEYLNPEDIVYYLGDAGDRGPEPWETIKAIMTDPQFIYLKGNHEDMLVDAVMYDNTFLLFNNGGYGTFEQLHQEDHVDSWIEKLNNLPYKEEYTNTQGQRVILTHAGFTPLIGFEPIERRCLWDREHFYDEYNESTWEDCYIVHGHTPTSHLSGEIKPYWYANNRKCCIDLGTFRTGHTTLLNLDTWENIIFEGELKYGW